MEALSQFLSDKVATPLIAGMILFAGIYYGLKRNDEKDKERHNSTEAKTKEHCTRIQKLEEGFAMLTTQQAVTEERRQGNNELITSTLKRIDVRLGKIEHKLDK